jgi:hypothetical protein
MGTPKADEQTEGKGKKQKKAEESIPFCTTAPSAEHTRGDEAEGPCDDSRTGDYEK